MNEILEKLKKKGIKVVRVSGDEIQAFCPFHKETKPSFFISVGLNRYHCFGCQRAGLLSDLIGRYLPRVKVYRGKLSEKVVKEVKLWRRLNYRDAFKRYEVRFDGEDTVVAFVRDYKQKLKALIFRKKWKDDRYYWKKGKTGGVFYGEEFVIGKYDEVIICEGIRDVWAIYEAGYPNVMANMGTNIEAKIKKLYKFRKVVLIFDGDRTGMQAVIKWKKKLRDKLYVDDIVVAGKDPDEVGVKRLKELLKGRIGGKYGRE